MGEHSILYNVPLFLLWLLNNLQKKLCTLCYAMPKSVFAKNCFSNV